MILRYTLRIIAFIITTILLYIAFVIIPVFVIDPSGRSLALYKEMQQIAHELKQYRKERGSYPDSLTQIGLSDQLCVEELHFKSCGRLYYKPAGDRQDFRMAMQPFRTRILFYHPEMSMTSEEYSGLSKEKKEQLYQKYHYMCFYCEAIPANIHVLGKKANPIYKQDLRIFSNPEEWPDLQ